MFDVDGESHELYVILCEWKLIACCAEAVWKVTAWKSYSCDKFTVFRLTPNNLQQHHLAKLRRPAKESKNVEYLKLQYYCSILPLTG